MPFGFTEKSAREVVQAHMNPDGEQAQAILPLTRKLLIITDRGRSRRAWSSIPWGQPRIPGYSFVSFATGFSTATAGSCPKAMPSLVSAS